VYKYNLIWWALKVTWYRSVIFTRFLSFLQWKCLCLYTRVVYLVEHIFLIGWPNRWSYFHLRWTDKRVPFHAKLIEKNILIKCWFLTTFKYLQIIRKWYSNSLSFLLLLLEQVPFSRRRGNNSYEKVYTRIIIESNWLSKKSIIYSTSMNYFLGANGGNIDCVSLILSWRWMCNHRKQMNTINLLCMLICYHVHHTIVQVWS
jgi:hypothetical protein